MSDITDAREELPDKLIIPVSETAKTRLIRKLQSWVFFLALFLAFSLFINVIFIVEYKL